MNRVAFSSFRILGVLLTVLIGVTSFAKTTDLDATYREGQRLFWKKDYVSALPLLESYLKNSVGKKYKRERLFWVIDQIGRIHLRVNRNPDKAIDFFEDILRTEDRLSDAERDDVGAWVAAAKDWKRNFSKVGSQAKEKKDFETGRGYFLKGKKKLTFPADDAGNTYFTLASIYLIPFINNNDSSKNISEALLMMGEIRHHLRTDPEYWNENFYLKEVIRRFPHTNNAAKAYRLLENDIKVGYSGSAGENIPPSISEMLRTYKALSQPKNNSPQKKRK